MHGVRVKVDMLHGVRVKVDMLHGVRVKVDMLHGVRVKVDMLHGVRVKVDMLQLYELHVCMQIARGNLGNAQSNKFCNCLLKNPVHAAKDYHAMLLLSNLSTHVQRN